MYIYTAYFNLKEIMHEKDTTIMRTTLHEYNYFCGIAQLGVRGSIQIVFHSKHVDFFEA